MPNVTTTKVVLNYYDTKCVRTQPSVNCDTDVQDVYEWALPSSHRVYSSMVSSTTTMYPWYLFIYKTSGISVATPIIDECDIDF